MAKCVNCEQDGGYLVENPGAMPQVYCGKDLPSFFNKANLPAHIKEIPLNHLHVAEEPVDEEPVAEELVIETTAPKVRKKAAAVVLEEEPVTE